ncbi:phosphopantetheine-binding protein [Aurantibacillus circumpalustris]|uniref:phosphopantetheine-binding protein n=1 Tax=Aurantibacillus circumpalustris TaxID=3036359 RepID=UPI00295B7CF1|nr:phosphopantetheine-binding protein [Aurantibacillus circumpalustris]
MDTPLIEADLIRFLENNILSEGQKLSADKILRDVGIDSFSIVEILLFIERKYGFVIPDEKLMPEHFKTVHTIALLVKEISEKGN